MKNRQSVLWTWVLVICLLAAPIAGLGIFSFAEGTAAEDEATLTEAKRVLYISSYSPALFTFDEQLSGIKDRFKGQPVLVEAEFMDTKNFHTEENLQNFKESLLYKLNNGAYYDAVIVGDDNGLVYLMANRDDLFPDTPIFFLGINNLETARISAEDPMVTGVVEAKSFYGTMEFAYRLNPDAKRFVCIVDQTASSQAELAEVSAGSALFPEMELYTIYTSDGTFEELYSQIAELTSLDILLWMSAVTDKDGNVMNYDELRRELFKRAKTPIYGFTTYGIGDGMFGGQLVSHVEQGYAAADMVMTYFKGTSVDQIAFSTESPNRYEVDYPLFLRFGFDLNDLPEDTLIYNRTYTFWEAYWQEVLLGIAVVVIETVIILLLIVNIRARRKSQIALVDSNEKVKDTNERLLSTVDDLNAANRELEDSITEVNERDQRIREMIYKDELTGLETRYALNEILDEIIAKKRACAIYMLNVDNFKNVNDAFGHVAGDSVLRKIGHRLAEMVSETTHIFRFGGDEFVVVAEHMLQDEAVVTFAETLNKCFTEALVIEGNAFVLSTSTGISKYPDHGDSRESLMKHADIALHEAKASGKDNYTVYNSRMNKNFHEKLRFQNVLREAFEKGEFYLNYQPIVKADTLEVYGFEALIRWYSSEFDEQISPYKLITEAEEMGLIVKLGDWIFREACRFAARVNAETDTYKYVSVNVSAVQLMYSGFVDNIRRIVIEEGAKPEYICLEMTETTLIEDFDLGNSIIRQLGNCGFKIALDDFGTGYSSLSYLKNFDIDILKIDKSFVDQILDSSYDRYLVEAVVKIAKERKIITVAEGVEALNQYKVLAELNCKTIQGYLFSKPLDESTALGVTDEEMAKKLET